MQATLKLRLVQWRIQKFVLGGEPGAWAVHPAGVDGAESPLRAWGEVPQKLRY